MFLSLTQQIRCFFSNKVILRQWKEEAELVSGTGYGEVCIEPEGTSLQIHFTVMSLPNFPSLLQHRINNRWVRCVCQQLIKRKTDEATGKTGQEAAASSTTARSMPETGGGSSGLFTDQHHMNVFLMCTEKTAEKERAARIRFCKQISCISNFIWIKGAANLSLWRQMQSAPPCSCLPGCVNTPLPVAYEKQLVPLSSFTTSPYQTPQVFV